MGCFVSKTKPDEVLHEKIRDPYESSQTSISYAELTPTVQEPIVEPLDLDELVPRRGKQKLPPISREPKKPREEIEKVNAKNDDKIYNSDETDNHNTTQTQTQTQTDSEDVIKRRGGMLVELDAFDFKPSQKRVPTNVQKRLEKTNDRKTIVSQKTIERKQRAAEERRKRERLQRSERARNDVRVTKERNQELKELESRKAEELKEFMAQKNVNAQMNRDLTQNKMKQKIELHHNVVSTVKERKHEVAENDIPPEGISKLANGN